MPHKNEILLNPILLGSLGPFILTKPTSRFAEHSALVPGEECAWMKERAFWTLADLLGYVLFNTCP
jgi:hypothetical protein